MDEKKARDAIDFIKTLITAGNGDVRLYVAIEVLEKQLPKKPKENGMYSWIFKKTKTYTCPTCGNCCLEKMMNERQDTDFCWNCGQKLDWPE